MKVLLILLTIFKIIKIKKYPYIKYNKTKDYNDILIKEIEKLNFELKSKSKEISNLN